MKSSLKAILPQSDKLQLDILEKYTGKDEVYSASQLTFLPLNVFEILKIMSEGEDETRALKGGHTHPRAIELLDICEDAYRLDLEGQPRDAVLASATSLTFLDVALPYTKLHCPFYFVKTLQYSHTQLES